MAISKVFAVCLGDAASISKGQLLEEYLKYHPHFRLWFFKPEPGKQNLENMALRLARIAKDADILIAVQGSTHPIEGVPADEVHMYIKGYERSHFVEFYPTEGSNPPHKELAKDLALLSFARLHMRMQ